MKDENDGFIDLVAYNKAVSAPKSIHGNLIKAANVVCSGATRVEVATDCDDQPTVITHRDGDTVTAVEFICSCGRSTKVSLEYDSPSEQLHNSMQPSLK